MKDIQDNDTLHRSLRSAQLSVVLIIVTLLNTVMPMEQRALKNVNNYLNTNIYSYLETSGGQNSNIYL
jgi:hypothetical protein